MQTLLVTGGLGFIGSNLIDLLLKNKYKVINIDENTITVNKEINIKEKYKTLKWGLSKDDVKPSDIFRLQEGNSADRKIVAEYCIQDCALVNKLKSVQEQAEKFQVIVTELIRSKGITLLINSGGQQGTLLHADQSFDITQEVIDAMNEKED